MGKLRVGIIGCGRISIVYAHAFHVLSDLCDLVMAVDKQKEKAEAFAKPFSASYGTTIEEMIAVHPDVVHVCTPHYLHSIQVSALLSAGINVLSEKPMGISMAEALSMKEAEEKSSARLGIILQNRYIEGVQRAKKLLDSGVLGKVTGAWSFLAWHRPPSYYQCDWKGKWATEGGGVLIDQAIHSIDLVQYLVNDKVATISGRIENRVLTMVEVEDVADAIITFSSGIRYSLFATNYHVNNSPIQVEIVCEKGKIHITGFEVTIECEDRTETIIPHAKPEESLGNQAYWGVYHLHEIREFYQDLMEGKPFPITADEGMKALRIVLGVYASSKENKVIESKDFARL